MSAALGDLVVSLSANVAQFASDMGKAAYIAEQQMKKIDDTIGLVKNGLMALGAGAISGLSFDALISKIEGVVESAGHLQQMAEMTGATVEGLSKLASVAKLSGTDTETLAVGLEKMSKSLVGAANGATPAAQAIRAIGLSAQELVKLSPDEAFTKIAMRLSEYKDGAEKTAFAQLVLGRSGAQLLPVMKDLADAGIVQVKVTAEQAQAADDYAKNVIRLKAVNDGVFKTIGLEIVPVLSDFAKALVEAQKQTGSLADAVKKFAQDGSIRMWAEEAALYLADVLDALRTVVSFADVLDKTFNVIGASLDRSASWWHDFFSRSKESAAQLSSDVDRQKSAIDALGAAYQAFKGLDRNQTKNSLLDQIAARSNLDGTPDRPRKDMPNPGALNTAKKNMEQQLALIEQALAQMRQQAGFASQTLDEEFSHNEKSIADYFAARLEAMHSDLSRTQAYYDQEIAILENYKKHAPDANEAVAAQTKINAIKVKQTEATAAAAQAEKTLQNYQQPDAVKKFGEENERLNATLATMEGRLLDAAKAQAALQDVDFARKVIVNDGSAEKIARIRELTIAQGGLAQVQRDAGIVESNLATAEGRIALQRKLGNQSEVGGMIAVSQARSEQVQQLTEMADKYEAIANAAGDPQMIANAAAFRLKIQELAASVNELGIKVQDTFVNGFTSAFTDFITGAKSAADAFKSFASAVISELVRMAAQALATKIFGPQGLNISGYIGGLFGTAGAAAGAVDASTVYGAGSGWGADVLQGKSTMPQMNVTVNVDSRTDASTIKSTVDGAVKKAVGVVYQSQKSGGWAYQ